MYVNVLVKENDVHLQTFEGNGHSVKLDNRHDGHMAADLEMNPYQEHKH